MKYGYILLAGFLGAGAGLAAMLITRPLMGGLLFPVIFGGIMAIIVPLILVLLYWNKIQH